jgi:ABC-type antimicrobial peptide transport system permease subunit
MHHWRVHLAVVAGAAVAAAVLTGALLVGDSVRGSLRALTEARLGGVEQGLIGDRFFRSELVDEIPGAAPAILLRGSTVHGDSGRRAGKVTLLGVDDRFVSMHGAQQTLNLERGDGQIFASAAISQALARELDAKPGDPIILRFGRFSEVPRDTLMGETDVEDVLVSLRVQVSEILPDGGLGQFGIVPSQQDPMSAFVSFRPLQRSLDLPGQVNAIFIGAGDAGGFDADAALAEVVQLEDLGLDLVVSEREFAVESGEFVLRPQVDRVIESVATQLDAPLFRVQSYLANSMQVGDRLLPYSLVVGIDGPLAPSGARLELLDGTLAPQLKQNEILLNRWAAEDLGVTAGDSIEFEYFAVGEREELIETKVAFTVRGVTAIRGLGADASLTPEYPGIQEAEDLASWDPPFPVELDLIRDKDEEYWDEYGATPKAFVSTATGDLLWSTRFGSTTSARLGAAAGMGVAETAEAFRSALVKELPPSTFGLSFRPLRAEGLAAAEGATDFAGLFIGFSFFLILSAAMLIGLLFGLGVERRAKEIGLRLAVGFPVSKVRNGFLAEGALLAAVGAALGLAGGVAYAWLMMAGLRTLWVGAVGSSKLELHIAPMSLPIGWLISMLIILVAIALTVRKLKKVPPPLLLAGSLQVPRSAKQRRWTPLLAWGSLLLGLGMIGYAFASGKTEDPALSFGAGSLLLVAGLAQFALWCRGTRRRGMGLRPGAAIASMAARNSAWNPGRSILSVALVATACFAIIMVASSKQEFGAELQERSSGTGGFALIAESDIAIYQDLNDATERAELSFDEEASASLEGARVYPMRKLAGDDASCLNLFQPESPSLLGLPQDLIERGGFSFKQLAQESDDPWSLLNEPLGPGIVPAFADANSAQWILKIGLGDDIIMKDEFGEAVQIRLVGLMQSSIFQSELLIAEKRFLEHFPSKSGYSAFLVDVDWERADELSQTLEASLAPFGVDAATTRARLEAFKAVEHTYMATFELLGGLGLLLGTIGLGIVLVRNVIERRGELATLRAFGFRRASLGWLVLAENAFLLFIGLFVGSGAALLGVAPRLASIHTSWGGLALTFVAIAAVGMLASVAAVSGALKTPLLPALKAER